MTLRYSLAICCRALWVSSTSIHARITAAVLPVFAPNRSFLSSPRSVRTHSAPASKTWEMKSWPSTLAPTIAPNSAPSPALRLSVVMEDTSSWLIFANAPRVACCALSSPSSSTVPNIPSAVRMDRCSVPSVTSAMRCNVNPLILCSCSFRIGFRFILCHEPTLRSVSHTVTGNRCQALLLPEGAGWSASFPAACLLPGSRCCSPHPS